MSKMEKDIDMNMQSTKDVLKQLIRNNIAIIIILGIASIERILVAKQFGVTYNLGNDDLSYVNSAITLVETGQITMHGVLSAQIMPGMPILLAPLILIFGKGRMMWVAMKCLWVLLGILSIYGVYRTGLLLDIMLKNSKTRLLPWKTAGITPGKIAAVVASSFMLAADFAWMDNLILTETPYMFFSIYLFYFSLLLGHYANMDAKGNARYINARGSFMKDTIGKDRVVKYFWLVVICFTGALFIRPTIAMYPLFLVIYLLIRKYDKRALIRQLLVATCVLIIVLTPWTIRNYMQFGHFIPLTYGMGNPLLLGTYQGEGYPEDEFIDYDREVKAKLSGDMIPFARNESGISPYMLRYYMLEYDGYKAKYRMSLWWDIDSQSMLKSYLWLKPKIIMENSFLWAEPFGAKRENIREFRHIQLIISGISLLFVILVSTIFKSYRKYRKNSAFWREINHSAVFLAAVYLSQVYLYAYTFAFERYGQTILFFQFVIIGWAVGILFLGCAAGNITKK